jgi:UDP-N-acetylglucosamine 2-epimerase (non-hydrolysing)
MPQPDVNLEVGSGSHAVQTTEVMKRLESVALERNPGVVLVYRDVNPTAGAALVCAAAHLTHQSEFQLGTPGDES